MKSKDKYKYSNITQKWGGKKVIKKFDSKMEEFLAQFTEEEQFQIIKLLSNFDYYTKRTVIARIKKLFLLFQEKCEQSTNNIVFTGVTKENKTSFSKVFFNLFWEENKLKPFSVENLSNLLANHEAPAIIAFVDDYSGSGNSFIKVVSRYLKLNKSLQRSKIYFLTIHCSELAINNIEIFAQKTNLDIECISLKTTPKAFEEHYIFNLSEDERKKFSIMSNNYKIKESLVFGKYDTEGLISFEYNTPNNTLGIFWTDEGSIKPLFFREKDYSNSELEKCIKNKQSDFDIIYSADAKDKNLQIGHLLNYLVIHEGSSIFDLELLSECGLTSEQLNKLIPLLFEKNYISISNGRISINKKVRAEINKINKKLEQNNSVEDISKKQDTYIPLNFESKFNGYKNNVEEYKD